MAAITNSIHASYTTSTRAARIVCLCVGRSHSFTRSQFVNVHRYSRCLCCYCYGPHNKCWAECVYTVGVYQFRLAHNHFLWPVSMLSFESMYAHMYRCVCGCCRVEACEQNGKWICVYTINATIQCARQRSMMMFMRIDFIWNDWNRKTRRAHTHMHTMNAITFTLTAETWRIQYSFACAQCRDFVSCEREISLKSSSPQWVERDNYIPRLCARRAMTANTHRK